MARDIKISGIKGKGSVIVGEVTGTGNIIGTDIKIGEININAKQMEKLPDEYAESLQTFSETVNEQLKTHNIPQEKAAPIQESIDKLTKEIEDVKPGEKITTVKKGNINAKINEVTDGILRVLPKTAAKATEIIATFTPLAPISKLIGKSVEEIVKAIQEEI